MDAPILDVRDLRTHFFTQDGVTRAVDGLSFSIGAGETLGIVGESGCGKSVTALSILRLLPAGLGRTVGGSVTFGGRDLLGLDEAEMRRIRGDRIAMVFQEPMTSLNPVLTVGEQIAEAVMIHQGKSKTEAFARAAEMLTLVRIPDAARRVRDYPHQFSGGMRQRVMIAMALSCHPQLLIADEPTTALDVTIQAQILDLMLDLQERIGMAIQFISHNLAVVSEIAHDIIVMYAGRIVERAPAELLFANPMHPYTKGLIATLPDPGHRVPRLPVIPGGVPDLDAGTTGCRFADRCARADAACRIAEPAATEPEPGHFVACFKATA